jgi:uncharacterized protein YukE
MVGGVMKMLQGPIMDVVGRITQSVNNLQEVHGQFGNFASTLGGAWIGADADAFVHEVQSRLIPEIMDLIAAIGGMPGGLNQAMDIMHSADSKAGSLAAGLGDTFGAIY